MSAGWTRFFGAFVAPAAGFAMLAGMAQAATAVWNPLESRYDAQLAATVYASPKGCDVVKVTKNLRRDNVEGIYNCESYDIPTETLASLDGSNPALFGPDSPSLFNNGQIGISTPSTGQNPVLTVGNDTSGEEEDAVDSPDPIQSVTGTDDTQDVVHNTGTSISTDSVAAVPLPLSAFLLFAGLGLLHGARRMMRRPRLSV